jgi:hypothetical protein
MMTYNEFYNTLTPDQLTDWNYEGVSIRDLYNEYLELNTSAMIQTYPDWVIEIMK